jgi:hypothetical protein
LGLAASAAGSTPPIKDEAMTNDTKEWQPIETAPKGEVVDLWIESAGPDADQSTVKFYCPNAMRIEGGLLAGRVTDMWFGHRPPNSPNWYPSGGLGFPLAPDVKPTHWMRRPAPPKRPR